LALSVAVGAAPSLFLLVFFYLKDRYEPEPRGHVALAFAKGALAILPSWLAAKGLELSVGKLWLALGGVWARLFEAAVMAGAVEEGSKWVIFLSLVYWWEEFDEPLDGVVYGVALALGFATVENILCVVRDGLGVGFLRAIFAVPAHALFGAAMGFYMGRAKLGRGRYGSTVTRGQRAMYLALAFLVPFGFHSAYDFALVELRGWWIYAVVSALSIALWGFVLRRVHTAQKDSPFRTTTTMNAVK
jgi:RsiW-degrading membrane proteinase PrsW (M82 family)